MTAVTDVAFGVVLLWGLATVVFDAVRMRRRDPLRTPGATWWRLLVEVKSQPVDAPLFVSGFALLFVAELAAHTTTWWLALSLPLGAMQVWYLRRYPDPWTRHGVLRPVAALRSREPITAERHVPLVIRESKQDGVHGQSGD